MLSLRIKVTTPLRLPMKMMSLCKAVFLTMAMCAGFVSAQPLEPVPVAAFFASPVMAGSTISPDGRHVAFRSSTGGKRDVLAVLDLQTMAVRVVAAFNDGDVDRVQWVNNQRLIFDFAEKEIGPADAFRRPGLFAINLDGTGLIELARRFGRGIHAPSRGSLAQNTVMLGQAGTQDSAFTYAARLFEYGKEGSTHVGLVKIDTLTGKWSELNEPPGRNDGWLLDHEGDPVLASGTQGGRTHLYHFNVETRDWDMIASQDDEREAIVPVGFGPTGTLYVSARKGRDTSALYAFDIKTRTLAAEPLLVTSGYDFDGTLIVSRNKLLGFRFTTDAPSIEWIDSGMKAVQEKVDKLLPATNNLIQVPLRPETPWVLVDAYSDRIPNTPYVFNTETGVISQLGETRPGIDPRRMGRQQAVRYKARDGLDIPALLTLPHGDTTRKSPLVVLVHGGPWVRGAAWGWSSESQFLASRGYAVLEPEFRGSTGFGWAHYLAGFKQWGLAMQNDIADGVRWAIGKGVIDPQRICIAGASYGGYATLMGLINDPDLYKCGIAWSGVSDIHLMYTGSVSFSNDLSNTWKEVGMPLLIGDLVKDAAQLQATSPIRQAARITQPLLIAHGGADPRVPVDHGTKLYRAVKRTNPNVEWLEYPGEGHGFYLPKTRIDFWTRVEKFLDKNIGKGAGSRSTN